MPAIFPSTSNQVFPFKLEQGTRANVMSSTHNTLGNMADIK